MLRKVGFTLLAVVLIGSAWATLASAAGQEKVTICHKPGTDHGVTLEIAAPALPAHLAHGDTEGACQSEVPPSEGCAAVNAAVPDPQTYDYFYVYAISGLAFYPGEVLHADITAQRTESESGSIGIVAAVIDSAGDIVTVDIQDVSNQDEGTASIDYTVVAGDDANGLGVAVDGITGGTFDLIDVNLSCTPAP
ncbi:MAG: hypothetical protein KDI62_22695 [Anaerolineae bacterium]|nr:hypothetical protein [Anaerolineae bacterium]MCB9106400.1 hypothetical protein [Anaerolineales bacterium]